MKERKKSKRETRRKIETGRKDKITSRKDTQPKDYIEK